MNVNVIFDDTLHTHKTNEQVCTQLKVYAQKCPQTILYALSGEPSDIMPGMVDKGSISCQQNN